MTYLFAYAQMLSMREEFFRTDSTLPRDTYSPACSFTKSFLRSRWEYKNVLLCYQVQTIWSMSHTDSTDQCHEWVVRLQNAIKQQFPVRTSIHTHYLQTAIWVNLSHISSAEPSLSYVIHNVVMTILFIVVVTHGYIGPTDQDLPSRVWLIVGSIATWENR